MSPTSAARYAPRWRGSWTRLGATSTGGLVVWHYWGGIVDALTALKDLPQPGGPDTPARPYEPPRDLHGVPGEGTGAALWIAPGGSRGVRIRLPRLKF
ncbi:hypothetical protein ACH347_22235 [Saccharopolyspora sp. 5N102]|uniref:hypothetical protein n=1 Tax=Saccharopolyspora sp. 5N102 TaxID=3375155 RepID=UPI0037BDB89D